MDDGWAVAVAVRAAQRWPERYAILGISACTGNVDATTAHQCVRSLLQKMDANAVRQVTSAEAPHALAKLPAETIILALGPLSHVAAALRIEPQMANRVTLATVGGVQNPWHLRRRFSDLNVRRDPVAAANALAAFGRRRCFPLDVVDRLLLDRSRVRKIGSASALGAYLSAHSQRWLHGAWLRHGRPAFPVWDLVAVLAMLELLPAARFDEKGFLESFDPLAAWVAVEGLLRL